MAAARVAESLKETVGDICRRKQKAGKAYRAINPWDAEDFRTLQFLARGEIQLNGFRNCNLREALYSQIRDLAQRKRASAKISRRLRLLRSHGLIRKVPNTSRYQLTRKGRRVAAAVLVASAVDTKQLMEMAA